jgi:hypothetical protein
MGEYSFDCMHSHFSVMTYLLTYLLMVLLMLLLSLSPTFLPNAKFEPNLPSRYR